MPFDITLFFRFYVLTVLNTLSILCSCFVLYHFVFDRTLRQGLNNHVFLILIINCLLFQIFDIPLILTYFRLENSWQRTFSLNIFWSFIDFSCFSIQSLLFAWATIERHMLIFNDRWFITRKQRLFLHYFPIITIVTYCFTYNLIVVVILSCQNSNEFILDFILILPCPYKYKGPILWDLICHQMIPTLTVTIGSISFFLRIIYQKSRLSRHIKWRQQSKMAIQLLSTAILYLSFNLPWVFIVICNVLELPIYIDKPITIITYVLSYYLICILPFIVCGTLSKLQQRLKKLYVCRNRINPNVIS